jgi:hypothetical protein
LTCFVPTLEVVFRDCVGAECPERLWRASCTISTNTPGSFPVERAGRFSERLGASFLGDVPSFGINCKGADPDARCQQAGPGERPGRQASAHCYLQNVSARLASPVHIPAGHAGGSRKLFINGRALPWA